MLPDASSQNWLVLILHKCQKTAEVDYFSFVVGCFSGHGLKVRPFGNARRDVKLARVQAAYANVRK